MPTQIGLISLGCAKNLIDSEIMLGHLQEEGMTIVKETAECVKKLEETYGKLSGDAEFEAAVMEAMKAKCPDTYSLMDGM